MRTEARGFLLAIASLITGCNSGAGGDTVTTGSGGAGFADPEPAPVFKQIEEFSYLGRLVEYPYGDGEVFFSSGGPQTQMIRCPPGIPTDIGSSCISSVSLDGQAAEFGDLKDGQTVEIHGMRIEPFGAVPVPPPVNHVAVSIDIHRAVVGDVESIDADHYQLTVLGQQVFAYAGIAAGVDVGDFVTVYGHPNDAGEILAERIDQYVGEPLYLLRGILRQSGIGRFTIGDLELDLSAATRQGFPGGAPLPGDSVIVFADQPPVAQVLSANLVRCAGQCAAESPWENGWVKGFLTAWRGPTDFDVDGIAIRPDWCECGYGEPFELGAYVYVSLYSGNADVTRAPTTSFRAGLVGKIESIDESLRELRVLGFPVRVSPATLIADAPESSYEYARSIQLDQLHVGDAFEIGGEIVGELLVAGRVIPDGDGAIVRTYDYALDRPSIIVAGKQILTDETTQVHDCDGRIDLGLDQLFASKYMAIWMVVDPERSPLAAVEIFACTEADR